MRLSGYSPKRRSVSIGAFGSEDEMMAELDAIGAPVSDDGNPVVFKDAEGYVYSQQELDAIYGEGDGATAGWAPSDWQNLIDESYVTEEAAATGQTKEEVKASNAVALSNPLLGSLLSGLGIAGAAGLNYLKSHPEMVPDAAKPLIPGLGVVKQSGKPQAKSNTKLYLILAGAAVAGLLLFKR